MLTVVVPTYNEAGRILPTMEQLAAELRSLSLECEILAIDESRDETPHLVRAFARRSTVPVRMAHFPHRLGKGGALVEGMREARGDVLFYDADSATPASEIPKLLAALRHSDITIGSRYLPGSRAEGITLFRRFSSRCFNLLVRLLFGLPYADTQCGFKAVRASAIPRLLSRPFNSRGWEWDIELLARARQLGLSVAEVPVKWRHVPGGPLEASSTFKTGWRMFKGILRLRSSL